MSQEWCNRNVYKNITSNISSIPYWDNRCGEFFYEKTELESSFNKFIENLEKYKPRDFVLENVGYDACCIKWDNLISEL